MSGYGSRLTPGRWSGTRNVLMSLPRSSVSLGRANTTTPVASRQKDSDFTPFSAQSPQPGASFARVNSRASSRYSSC